MKTALKMASLRSPKAAKDIMIEEQSRLHLCEPGKPPEARTCSLAEKIEELALKEGYTNAQTLSVIVQLLTNGKVSIGFRDYSQRLQLVCLSDTMSRAQAAEVFDKHLGQIKISEKLTNGFTQKIQFQTPRIWLPRV